VPFLSVRAILDRANQELPSYIEDLVRKKDRGLALRVVLSSLARPTRIPGLLRLARQARRAQKSLATFARLFVAKAVAEGVSSPA